MAPHRFLKVLALAMGALMLPALCSPAIADAQAEPQAQILSVTAVPSTLGPSGGAVTITARVENTQTCQLSLLSTPALSVVYSKAARPCAGAFTATVVAGANASSTAVFVPFRLMARSSNAGFSSWYEYDFTVVEAGNGATPSTGPGPVPSASAKPVIWATVSPTAVGSGGGTVTVRSTLSHGVSCQLKLLTATPGLPSLRYPTTATPCSTSYTARVAIGPNEALVPHQLAFEVVASNKEGSAFTQTAVSLTVPKPKVVSALAEPADLGTAGGVAVITAKVKDATSCHLKLASPYVGFPVTYSTAATTCSGGVFTTHVSLGTNNTMISRPVWFSVVGSNGGGGSQGNVSVTLGANHDDSVMPRGTSEPAPAVTVTGSSNAPTGFNVGTAIIAAVPDKSAPAHLTTTFTASAHMNCFTSATADHPCPLPAGATGVITWQVVKMGDWQQNEDLAACTTNITTAKPASTCKVWWGTYGDHEIQATVSVKWPGVKTMGGNGQATVNLPAPVDFGASAPGHGFFNIYGNMQYGDCWFASAADYIEMVTGTAPSPTAMMDNYFAMVKKGDSLQQWWAKSGPGLAGTHLVSDTTWTTWTVPQVEHYLLVEHKPLYVGNLLPIEWGTTTTGGRGGHDWDIAGYSSYGPMVVTWGEEFQIPWGEFEYITTGVQSFTIAG